MARFKTKKQLKRKIFIFTEGKTEKMYFDALRQPLSLANAKIKILEVSSTGIDLLNKATNQMRNNPSFERDDQTDVILIFDKDNMSEHDFKKLDERIKRENMSVGFSNVSFEVWLLAHFELLTTKIQEGSILKQKLTNYLGQDYKKTDPKQLKRMAFNYKVAIRNAKAVKEIDFYKQSTNIGVLIEQLKSSSS